MKRIKALVILLIVALLVTGCNKSIIKTKNSKKNSGKIYNITYLQDGGVDVFQTLLPEGWTAKIYSEQLLNSVHPFIETVVITNKDESAKITILSQNSYVENAKYNEGPNYDYYTTYLHYMDSNTYSDYFMDKVFNGAQFVKEEKVPKAISDQLAELHKIKLDKAYSDAQQVQAAAAASNVTIGIENVGYSDSKRIYQNGETIYETTTCVTAIATRLTSNLSSLLDSYAINWEITYTIVYEAKDQATYDKYYDEYNFIIANSNFTLDYYQMVEYVSSKIVNMITTIYAERSKAALDSMNDYIDGNYSSTSAQSTNDKVMEMWDDVIKEQDSYITEDGTQIKTSIMNDTVAQNGNEIYIGSKAGIPTGFNELSKGYK